VDRRKLEALGIPRGSLAAAAWLLLFWKAAAAGWRSYSVGQNRQLSRQPDFPVEETAFLFRVLSQPALKRLCPREPDLSRGSIAFAPAMQPAAGPVAGRLKVLLVSPFLPYPLSHGGAVRIYNLCRALAGRVDFVLAAIREARDAVHYGKLHEIFREVYVVDIDEPASGDERTPGQVRQYQSRGLRALIADVSRKWKPDLVQIEYTHLAAFRDSAPDVPAILVEHDLTFSLYRQLAENRPSRAARREYERWLAFEQGWLGAYDGVWTVCEDDRHAAIRGGGRRADRTFTVPNGVDIGRFVPCEEPTPEPEIFYVGSFRHVPNVLGFEILRREIMPRVWSSFPNARLRVVAGPQHEWFWRKFSRRDAPESFDRRIEIHGFVEDLRPLYARAAVVVAPLEVSAGTNIKVLEAMACGKALVTTPAGCAGLGLQDGYDALIRVDWADFARSVCDLLSEAALRRHIGAQARRTAEQRFSWTAIADHAYQSYLALAARP
jgi:glycosyltransferase involved in cell wall biosynthesis